MILDANRLAALAAGQKRYAGPKPCWRGHSGERFSVSGDCVECARVRKWKYLGIDLTEVRPTPSVCEGCGAAAPLALDHCHTTGNFRGWLCMACNTALGILRDSPTRLQGLLTYLNRTQACS